MSDYVSEAEELLDQITDERLTAWEREFVDDMSSRIHQYGSRTFVSDKQIETLRRIAEK